MSASGDAARGEVTVVATGELDLETLPALERALGEARARRPSLLVVDMGNVTFCDSLTVSALVRTASALRKTAGAW